MKAVVAAFNQEKALVGAFSVLTNLQMELFQALSSLLSHFYNRPFLGVIVAPGSFMPMISELNTPSYLDKSINFFETLNVTLIPLITQCYLQSQSTIICIPCNSINFQIIYNIQFTQWTTMTKPSNEI